MRALLVLLLLTSTASAQTAADVEAAIAEARFADAYDLAGKLVAATPADADARYWAAVAALRLVLLDEAERHLSAGLATHPDDIHLLGLRAQVLLSTGDEAGARATAQRALAIDPTAPDAATALEEIRIGELARARLAGEDPGLAPGSASAFVDGVIARIAAGASPPEIAEAFDVEMLSSAPSHLRNRETLVHAVKGALGEARRMRDNAGQKFYGWVTDPEREGPDGHVIVDVLVPIESTLTARQTAAIAAAVDDPELRGTIDPETLARIEGVPPEDRAGLLERMQGVHSRNVMDLHFTVAGAAGAFRIVDLEVGGISLKGQFGNFGKLMNKVDPPPRFRITPELIGILAGVIGGLVVFGFLLARKRR